MKLDDPLTDAEKRAVRAWLAGEADKPAAFYRKLKDGTIITVRTDQKGTP